MTIGSLIERDVELDVLSAAVARGSGVVVVEAPRGSRQDRAAGPRRRCSRREAGCLVRRAAPGPLERHFAFGVIRALLDTLRDVPRDPTRRRDVAHGGRCGARGAQRPLALVVDDAQWADRSSLEVLSYLARRIEDVPLLILVAARADDPGRGLGPADAARRGPRGDRPLARSR